MFQFNSQNHPFLLLILQTTVKDTNLLHWLAYNLRTGYGSVGNNHGVGFVIELIQMLVIGVPHVALLRGLQDTGGGLDTNEQESIFVH